MNLIFHQELEISTGFLVRARNKVDFPTFGKPTMPMERDIKNYLILIILYLTLPPGVSTSTTLPLPLFKRFLPRGDS